MLWSERYLIEDCAHNWAYKIHKENEGKRGENVYKKCSYTIRFNKLQFTIRLSVTNVDSPGMM